MKKTLAFFVVFSFLLSLGSAFAVPHKRYDATTKTCRVLTFYNSGWVSDGNTIFKKSCKTCHHQGNDKGATFLYTESFTPKGWNRVFAERYPACARNGSWASLSQEQILKLNDFLYWNGWGTYDPNSAESCG
ncbi:MAG: hypothetical protein M0017_05120 [Desulfobacteraceae bacterium]|nr:hypothetical protein [Desulfobacteraceae bacterium]